MFGDYQERYDLGPNTNRRTPSEWARLQEDPPRTSTASGYQAAQYARPEYSMPHTDPGYSRPLQYPAAPANLTPYSKSGYLRQSSASIPPPQYPRPEYSMPHTDPGYSRPLQYPAAPARPTPYSDFGYPRQSSASVPPPQYARSSYSVQNDSSGETEDDLADLFGQFSISKDPIDEVVEEVLTRDLKRTGNEKLLPTDPIFVLSHEFAERWDISDKAVDSHIKLACGYLKFPVILLLNPAPTHEIMAYDKMVAGCITLRWIEDVLYKVGLKLEDVIILDACTLLGKKRIEELEREGEGEKERAMAEAYDVTQEMLRRIQPNIILSCQCMTGSPDWSAGGHVLAWKLCSSIRSAQNREVKEVSLNGRTIKVIQAYHPSGFLNDKGDRNPHHDTSGHLLEGVFRTVYSPCGNWKRQHLIAARASSNPTNVYRSFYE